MKRYSEYNPQTDIKVLENRKIIHKDSNHGLNKRLLSKYGALKQDGLWTNI